MRLALLDLIDGEKEPAFALLMIMMRVVGRCEVCLGGVKFKVCERRVWKEID